MIAEHGFAAMIHPYTIVRRRFSASPETQCYPERAVYHACRCRTREGGGQERPVQTLRQRVHTALREKILRREIRPGQRLIERELAADLGVSRTPVRECLLWLQMEGLADTSPGLGVVVREITGRQVREALAVREALDALAAQEAASNRDDEDLALLGAAVAAHERAVCAAEVDGIAAADAQFHARVYLAAHNSVLAGVRHGFALYESFYFHGDFYHYTPEAFVRSWERHRQILQTIADRDPAAAEWAARLHIQEAAQLARVDEERR